MGLLQPGSSPQRQVEVSVRNKILYLIQAWAHAFRNEPKYKVVQDTYQIMKVEGQCRPQRWVPVGQIWAPGKFIWSAGGQKPQPC